MTDPWWLLESRAVPHPSTATFCCPELPGTLPPPLCPRGDTATTLGLCAPQRGQLSTGDSPAEVSPGCQTPCCHPPSTHPSSPQGPAQDCSAASTPDSQQGRGTGQSVPSWHRGHRATPGPGRREAWHSTGHSTSNGAAAPPWDTREPLGDTEGARWCLVPPCSGERTGGICHRASEILEAFPA